MKKSIIVILFAISTSCLAQMDDLYLKGTAEIRKGNFETAQNLLTDALKKNPADSGKILFYRGIAYFNNKQFDNSIIDFKKAFDLNIPDAAIWLAKSYAEQLQAKLSVFYIKRYLSFFPEKDYKAILTDTSFRNIQASNEWQVFVSEIIQTTEGETTASFYYFLQKNDFQSAHRELDEALLKNPTSDYFHSLKALCYEAEKNYTLALYEIKQSISANSLKSEYYFSCGNYELNLNEYNAAASSFEKVLKLKPEAFESYIKSAKAYLMAKELIKAKQKITTYLQYFNNDTAAIFLSAQIDYESNNLTSALKQLNSIFIQNIPKAEWYLLRGMIYYQSGSYNLAASDLSMSLDLTPNNKEANYYLGLCHYQQGNNQLACYYWQRAEKFGDLRSLEYLQKNCGK